MAAHEMEGLTDKNGEIIEPGSKTSFRSSFWFVIILVGLFIAALNFISVMSNSEEPPSPATKEATANETLQGENGVGKSESPADTTQFKDTLSRHKLPGN